VTSDEKMPRGSAALSLEPGTVRDLLLRANARLEARDARGALPMVCELLLAMGPQHPSRPITLALLATIYVHVGRPEDALTRSREAVRLDPKSSSVRGAHRLAQRLARRR
jgi:predicted Zn-dependent protease